MRPPEHASVGAERTRVFAERIRAHQEAGLRGAEEAFLQQQLDQLQDDMSASVFNALNESRVPWPDTIGDDRVDAHTHFQSVDGPAPTDMPDRPWSRRRIGDDEP